MPKRDIPLYDERFTNIRDILYGLGSTTESAAGPIGQYIDVLVFAASYGIRKNAFIPTTKNGLLIPESVIKNGQYDRIISAFAMMHTGKAETVLDLEEAYKIFSGYANGGFDLIENLFEEKKAIQGDDKIEELLMIIQEIALENEKNVKKTKKK